ncbi:peptidylprolyl isomerase [Candidatus Haliotispira prima]|uniref:peptidylprolyl isomerase n=1 Tax=Candidatus Haliotispira prima TaxID=3034016 RepID=A0ABY8MND7_9SPIO|nr:peptidylprolyl isomerase [Candidatus Haliotispira prima]
MSSNAILAQQKDGLYANVRINSGDILCKLEFEHTPITVASFIGLAEGRFAAPNATVGQPYFDGLNFHRVEPNFVIQGGDPKGNGTGGPGYEFPNEIHSALKHGQAGILSMANAGPDTNGSQFFITLGDASFLDGGYSVFGSVVSGLELVKKVKKGDVMERVTIHRKGQAAEKFAPNWEEFQAMITRKNGDKSGEQTKAEQNLLNYIQQTWPDGELQKNPNGLQHKILRPGKGKSGEEAGAKQYSMHYTLWVPQKDGSMAKVDSSRDRGEPLTIAPEQVVSGWGLTLPLMKQGEQRVLLIPGDLGYGKRGQPPVIPPNSFLLFEMETVHFE